MSWAALSARANAAMLRTWGLPISYQPADGSNAISTSCILLRDRVSQSQSPAFFADVQVDPLVITAPKKGDVVEWADLTLYVVAQVIAGNDVMPTLALHRKYDAI